MIRTFFVLWFFLTVIAFGWAWIMRHEDRKLAKFWLKRAAISAVIALVVIGVGLTLNNISGV